MADSKNLDQKEKIWTLNTESEDVDLIDTNDLLDEDDLKKPDPCSLKATGIETKRKACANCTCGLAEELDEESRKEREKDQAHKSSCGNCYLGDAFRCAGCPYLGTPAFKPGEKVVLDNKSDL